MGKVQSSFLWVQPFAVPFCLSSLYNAQYLPPPDPPRWPEPKVWVRNSRRLLLIPYSWYLATSPFHNIDRFPLELTSGIIQYELTHLLRQFVTKTSGSGITPQRYRQQVLLWSYFRYCSGGLAQLWKKPYYFAHQGVINLYGRNLSPCDVGDSIKDDSKLSKYLMYLVQIVLGLQVEAGVVVIPVVALPLTDRAFVAWAAVQITVVIQRDSPTRF